MNQMFTKTETAAQRCSTMATERSRSMETGNHSKNGANPKSQRSRGKLKDILIMAVIFLFFSNVTNTWAQGEKWKKNFGGNGYDCFESIIAVSDGYVAVGSSNTFNSGDWLGIQGKGGYDAIIVKYDEKGNVKWKKNFGANGSDYFYSVAKTSNGGFVAVGSSSIHDNGDWAGYQVQSPGWPYAIIVTFDAEGGVISKTIFSPGTYVHDDIFQSVIAVSDGYVAVGKHHGNAVIVKYNTSLTKVDWEKKKEISSGSEFKSVVAVPGGYVAAGSENFIQSTSDAIIVKYNNDGGIDWDKKFGGNESYFDSNDCFNNITVDSDGNIIVAGYSDYNSFGGGDWLHVEGNGRKDAIIVKYKTNGDILWKKHFGGSDYDEYSAVTAVSDGYVAVGNSLIYGNDEYDWKGILSKGGVDATIVKYDKKSDVVWKKTFGGNDADYYNSVVEKSNEIVVVGRSGYTSFGNGDWQGVTAKGVQDAIIVKYPIDRGVGISDVSVNLLHITPNPARTELHITLPTQAPADYTIFNLTGQTIQKGVLPQSSTINIVSLPSGLYFLLITTENGVVVRKVVKR